MSVKFQGLDHLAIRVSDLQRSKVFYHDVLGFHIVRESETNVLMFAHGLLMGLVGNNPNTPQGDTFNPFRVGLDHVALRVSNRNALAQIKAQLDAAGAKNNGLEKDSGSNADYLVCYDPDGLALEFYALPFGIKIFLKVAGMFNLFSLRERRSAKPAMNSMK